jgi:quercetin dioxygenase-like cupin family protein
MRKRVASLTIGCLMTAVASLVGADAPRTDIQVIVAEDLAWVPVAGGLGAEFAVVRGDPSKAGTYVIRVRFPAGIMDTPHFHSADRHVTVIDGIWHAGVGAEFDPTQAQPLRAGSYMFHPAGAVHWDGAAGDEDAIVQIIGIGPVTSTQADSESAVWVKVN